MKIIGKQHDGKIPLICDINTDGVLGIYLSIVFNGDYTPMLYVDLDGYSSELYKNSSQQMVVDIMKSRTSVIVFPITLIEEILDIIQVFKDNDETEEFEVFIPHNTLCKIKQQIEKIQTFTKGK